jgi:hypothetical protein
MKKKVLREKDGRFCRLEVELSDVSRKSAAGPGEAPFMRLSICGTEGSILSREAAEQMAHDYWLSFFEDCPEELGQMISKWKDSLMPYFKEHASAEEAAVAFVLDTDGALHGVDVVAEDGDLIYVFESGGQILDELEQWFPEVKPFLKWHLNDMHPGCEHQEELGWKRGKTINLARETCTPAQLSVLEADLAEEVAKERVRWIDERLKRMQESRYRCHQVVQAALGMAPTVFDMEAVEKTGRSWTVKDWMKPRFSCTKEERRVLLEVLEHLRKLAEAEIPDRKFTVASFENCIGAPCPECGYKYGTAWQRRELPQEVLDWFESLGGEETSADGNG